VKTWFQAFACKCNLCRYTERAAAAAAASDAALALADAAQGRWAKLLGGGAVQVEIKLTHRA
jgi:hypothetical protein